MVLTLTVNHLSFTVFTITTARRLINRLSILCLMETTKPHQLKTSRHMLRMFYETSFMRS
ncbi:Uncharacterised protein [Shigella sonnei]|nr:Uncharacterised protein [Shigella sonnei]SVG70898.1 Uncharacterised protein [Shigella sonnei]